MRRLPMVLALAASALVATAVQAAPKAIQIQETVKVPFDLISPPVKLRDGSYAFAGNINGAGSKKNGVLVFVSANGQETARVEVERQANEQMPPIALPNGNVFFITMVSSYIVSPSGHIVREIPKTGGVGNRWAAPLKGGNIAWAQGNLITVLNQAGDILNTVPVANEYPFGLLTFKNGNFIPSVSMVNSRPNNVFAIYDKDGRQVRTQTMPGDNCNPIDRENAHDLILVGCTSSGILFVNSQGDIVKQVAVPSALYSMSRPNDGAQSVAVSSGGTYFLVDKITGNLTAAGTRSGHPWLIPFVYPNGNLAAQYNASGDVELVFYKRSGEEINRFSLSQVMNQGAADDDGSESFVAESDRSFQLADDPEPTDGDTDGPGSGSVIVASTEDGHTAIVGDLLLQTVWHTRVNEDIRTKMLGFDAQGNLRYTSAWMPSYADIKGFLPVSGHHKFAVTFTDWDQRDPNTKRQGGFGFIELED